MAMYTASGMMLPMGGGMQQQQQRAHLYIGQLSPRVTEYMLQEIFSVAGPVLGVKIVPDRNFQHGGLNYGFVEFYDMRGAETAMQTLNGRKIFDTEIRVNWAYQNNAPREDISNHNHVFVGDLSPEVTDEILQRAFSAFGSLSDARIMADAATGKSRGYGFLAFRDKNDAEQAIATMNGEWLGSRAIRVNWANSKSGGGGSMEGGGGAPMFSGGPRVAAPPGGQQGSIGGGMGVPEGGYGGGFGNATIATEAAPVSNGLDYGTVVTQSSATNCTVYVGNLVPYTTQADLIPLFTPHGTINELRTQSDRGFAFVKLDTHEKAAAAICATSGQYLHGRPIKCSWGKEDLGGPKPDKPVAMQTGAGTPGVASPTAYPGYDPAAYAAYYAQWYAAQMANGTAPPQQQQT